jgi:hypothetical protein
MRNILVWVGVVVALLVLVFHIIHIAADYEFIFLTVAVLLIGLGVAPYPV